MKAMRRFVGGAGTRGALAAALLGSGALIAAGCGSSSSKLTPEQLIKQVTPSVVRIQGPEGGGTGFVVDAARQLVLTNAHVVAGKNGAALKAQVGNETGTTTPVRIVAVSPCDDLAVVKLVNPVPHLKALALGTNAKVTPGESVTVMGFPGSLQSGSGSGQADTVVPNTGTVSQANIQVNTNSSEPNFDPNLPAYQSMIVHQAPVNHGDSGGPLLNAEGEVIGINTLTNEGQAQGQYYAIGIAYAERLLPELEAGHSHAYIGWDLAQLTGEHNSQLKEQLTASFEGSAYSSDAAHLAETTAAYLESNPPTTGMYDTGDAAGTPAAESGLEGKLILLINKTHTTSLQEVCSILGSASPGEKLHVEEIHIASGEDPKQIVAGESKPQLYVTELTMPKE
jgi:S1-C subfamily serine protease